MRPGHHAPAELAMERTFSVRLSEWLDVQSRQLFITPAVVMILIFSIFPLVVSLVLAFARNFIPRPAQVAARSHSSDIGHASRS